ncbi:MAG TPA: methyltransferase domain-containing protein [Solirubrobacteraceae bacterium]|nr:methyltransferase domain-containing protein [Solirubrobacteraceae bacterium]
MQPLVRAFVEDALELLGPPDPVVEFGSMQVEAAQEGDLRPLFAGRDYTGTDFREGPGVDRVEDLRALTLADDSVGTAICLETLEHCEDPLTACRELARVVRPGGVCLVSTPFLLGIHGYPSDFFRFTPEAMRSMLGGFDSVWAAGIGDPGAPQWVFAIAAQGRELGVSLERLPRLREAQERWDRAEGRVRVGPLRIPPGTLVKTLAAELPRLARERVRRR